MNTGSIATTPEQQSRRRPQRTILVLLAAAAGLSWMPGSTSAQSFDFGVQVRPRTEFREPIGAEERQVFTSMRTRAQVGAELDGNVRAFLQLQDVRFFGEETSTLGDFSADNLDLHQGWVELGDGEGRFLGLRAGRQEMILGGERLVGPVGWTQQGRAFDGVRLRTRFGRVDVDWIGYQLSDQFAGTNAQDAELLGAYGVLRVDEGGTLDLYTLFRRSQVDPGADTREGTFGARYVRSGGQFSYRVEGSLQSGTRTGQDVSAFMVGARVGRQVADGKGSVTLWYDYLSGDSDLSDSDAEVFNTLFATNHKFYGFADLFLDIPAHTAGRGLQDIAVKLRGRPHDDVSIGGDLHFFRLAESGGAVDGRLGEELDVSVTWRYVEGVSLVAGGAYVLRGDGFADIGRLTEDMTWGYLMLNAVF